MKKIQTTIIILFSCFIYSQNNSAFEIEFNGNVYFDSKKDSLTFSEFYGKMDSEITERLFSAEKQIVNIKKDSILLEEFPKKVGPSKTMFIRTFNTNERLDLDSGKKIKWNKPYVIAKYRKISNYKRIQNEDMEMANDVWFFFVNKIRQ